MAVRYLRRSTDRREPFIPDQEKAIERYAVEHGLELARLFVDDGASCGRRGSCRLDAGQESASTQHPCPHGQAC